MTDCLPSHALRDTLPTSNKAITIDKFFVGLDFRRRLGQISHGQHARSCAGSRAESKGSDHQILI